MDTFVVEVPGVDEDTFVCDSLETAKAVAEAKYIGWAWLPIEWKENSTDDLTMGIYRTSVFDRATVFITKSRVLTLADVAAVAR